MSIYKRWRANRWFYLAVLFLLVNAYGVLRIVRRDSRWPDQVRVNSFQPGDDRAISPAESLKWTFSTEMVSGAKTGKWTRSGPVEFQPAVSGSFCWATANELWFSPSGPWRECTPFRAFLDEDVKGLDGRRVASPRLFKFHTRPLEFKEVRLIEFNRDREATVQITFSDPASLADVPSHISIAAPGGKQIFYSVVGQRDSAMLLLRTGAMVGDDSECAVTIKKGLHSDRGPLGLEDDINQTVQFSQVLALTKLEPVSRSFDEGEIRASFTAGVDVRTAFQFIEINPKVSFVVEEPDYDSNCRIVGAFLPGSSYAITFHRGMKGTDGRSLSSDITRQVYFPDRPSSITFRTSGHYLSTLGNLLVPVTTVNVRKFTATVRRVYANNLVEFARRETIQGGRSLRGYYDGGDLYGDVGQAVGERTYTLESRPNEACETRIDLKEFLQESHPGAFHIMVNPEKGESADHLVVATDIGLTAKASRRDLLVWANSIHTLKPISGARVRVLSKTNQQLAEGITDTNGVIRLTDGLDGEERPFLVTVTKEDELSFLKLDGAQVAAVGDFSGRPYLNGGYEAHVFTDRGIYRPGETVHVKGIVRGRDVSCPPSFPVQLHVMRPDGKRDRLLSAMLTDFGTAEFTVEIPDYAATGLYSLQVKTPGADDAIGWVTVAVEEFVPPQIAVELKSETTRVAAGNAFSFEVAARHLFGRPAIGNAVTARVHFIPDEFRHPAWAEYKFGDPERQFDGEHRELGKATLDGEGKATFHVQAADSWRPASALKAVISCTVRENSGRAVSASTVRSVDAYPFYIGIKPSQRGDTVRVGEPEQVSVAAVKPDGAKEPGVERLSMTLNRVSWATVLKRDPHGCYSYQSERQLTAITNQVVRLVDGTGACTISSATSGEYLLSIRDPKSDSSSSITFFASSPEQEVLAWSMENPERIDLQLDRASYTVGDEATLIIKAPFTGKALFTIESDRVLDHRVIVLEKNTATVKVPVTSACSPNVYCFVSLIRPVKAGEKWFGHRAVGCVPLVVESAERRLQVKLSAPDTLRPQARLPVTVEVTDSTMRAVKAEVVVAAVDEGICMLSDFRCPDPCAFFWTRRLLGIEQFDIYSLLMPEVNKSILNGASAPGGDANAMLRKRLNPITARRFKPVALWSSTLMTGDDGRAAVPFDVPEFTGRLRLMVVAVDRERFGSNQRSVTVKRPLIVRSSLPRFLAPSDTCRMPVQVFNETGHDGEALVRLACDGALSATAEKTIHLKNAGNGQLTLDVLAKPVPGVGTAKLHVAFGEETYDESFEISVRPATGRQTVSCSGSVTAGSSVDLDPPADWLRGTANTELWCSGMPAVHLGGSLDYLLR